MSFRLSCHGPAALALALGAIVPVAVQCAPAPAAPPAPVYAAADWKPLDPANLMVIDTSKGRVVVELVPAMSAEHVDRIKTLTKQGYYDGLVFFRVIDQFMAQTGDKANTGAGKTDIPALKGAFTFRRGPEVPFSGIGNGHGGAIGFVGPMAVNSQPDDLMGLTADGKVKAYGLFCPGVAGMARTGDPDSGQTQFFLMRQTFPTLDAQYTPFGRVVAGLEVVRAIKTGEPPISPDTMTKVRMAADIPAAERPNVWRVDPASPDFRANLAATLAARGAEFTPCDIAVPSEIRK
jgi:peptidylprolyl isomerase